MKARADWLPRAIVAGFIGATAMLLTFGVAYLLAYLLAGVQPGQDSSTQLINSWFYALTHNPLTDLAGSHVYAVAGLHFLVAIVWAVLYARWAEPWLEGPGWVRGASFAMLPWLLSVVILLPILGGGFLGMTLGAGPLPLIGNLILHLAFGATMGTVYGPLGDMPADSLSWLGPRDDFETSRRSEVRTAEGILGGLIVGMVVSIATVLLSGAAGSLLGLPQAAFVLACTILGGAVGALIGSFQGLSVPGEIRKP